MRVSDFDRDTGKRYLHESRAALDAVRERL